MAPLAMAGLVERTTVAFRLAVVVPPLATQERVSGTPALGTSGTAVIVPAGPLIER